MAYIERVVHVREKDKVSYDTQIQELTNKLKGADFDYNLTESRYNNEANGYIAEVTYGFWVNDAGYLC